MIDGADVVRALADSGFRTVSGVPCSILDPLIHALDRSTELRYIGAANEGEAVAIAAGSELGGQPSIVAFQNSGLGNAINPLTSLTATLRIPILLITSWRGQPDGPPDEPQHEIMGGVTPQLLSLIGIPSAVFPATEEDLHCALQRARNHMSDTGTPFALIVPRGRLQPTAKTRNHRQERLSPTATLEGQAWGEPLPQDGVLRTIQGCTDTEDILVATTGFTGRALYHLADRPNQLYVVGSMGCASSLGLGLALAQPHRRVIVIDGDGAALMHMGAMAVIGATRPPNLVHVLLDNGVHDSTGSQPTVSPSVDFVAIAHACGYPSAARATTLDMLASSLRSGNRSLVFIHVQTPPRDTRRLPRPTVAPADVAARLRHHLGVTGSAVAGHTGRS